MRFLIESALVPTPLLVRITGRNAFNDAIRAGWSGRPWLRGGGSWSVGYRYNDPAEWSAPHFDDVRPVTPPPVFTKPIVEWLFVNGTDSVKALTDHVGHRLRCDVAMAARRRGTNKWSLTHLDRIHPDQTCGATA